MATQRKYKDVRHVKFLLIQLDFELYFIKPMCIQGHTSLYSGVRLMLRLAPKSHETYVFGCALCLLKLCFSNIDENVFPRYT